MNAFLDQYCERIQPGLWDEPLNALTNVAFLAAAFILLGRYLQSYRGRLWWGWDIALLIALLLAIGVGSGLWHLYAQRWALLADVIPISLFINVYLLVFLARVAALRPLWIVSLFLLFHGVNAAVATVPGDFLNGSVFYLPAWAALVLMTLYLRCTHYAQWPCYAWASGIFLVSLTFRTLDQTVCSDLPIGTHFLWHLLNAATLYLLVKALLPDRPDAAVQLRSRSRK